MLVERAILLGSVASYGLQIHELLFVEHTSKQGRIRLKSGVDFFHSALLLSINVQNFEFWETPGMMSGLFYRSCCGNRALTGRIPVITTFF